MENLEKKEVKNPLLRKISFIVANILFLTLLGILTYNFYIKYNENKLKMNDNDIKNPEKVVQNLLSIKEDQVYTKESYKNGELNKEIYKKLLKDLRGENYTEEEFIDLVERGYPRTENSIINLEYGGDYKLIYSDKKGKEGKVISKEELHNKINKVIYELGGYSVREDEEYISEDYIVDGQDQGSDIYVTNKFKLKVDEKDYAGHIRMRNITNSKLELTDLNVHVEVNIFEFSENKIFASEEYKTFIYSLEGKNFTEHKYNEKITEDYLEFSNGYQVQGFYSDKKGKEGKVISKELLEKKVVNVLEDMGAKEIKLEKSEHISNVLKSNSENQGVDYIVKYSAIKYLGDKKYNVNVEVINVTNENHEVTNLNSFSKITLAKE